MSTSSEREPSEANGVAWPIDSKIEIKVENPFAALHASLVHPDTSATSIASTAAAIRDLYATHRVQRDAAQRKLLLEAKAPIVVDEVLSRIVGSSPDTPNWSLDDRHNVTIWTRPSEEVKELVRRVQKRLREAVRGGACLS